MSDFLLERFVIAIEKIADIMQRRYDDDHRVPEPAPEAEIFVRGQNPPQPETKAAYDSFEEGTGRFENLIQAARRETSAGR